MGTAQEFFNEVRGDAYPSPKFEKIGDSVVGTIIDEPKSTMVKNKFTQEDELSLPVNVDTDSGPQTIWFKAETQRATALKKAVAEAGQGLAPGGKLGVKFVEERPSKYGNPQKIYAVQYEAPTSKGVDPSEIF